VSALASFIKFSDLFRSFGRGGGALPRAASLVSIAFLTVFPGIFAIRSTLASPEWPQFGGSRGRVSNNDAGPASISSPTWTFASDTSGNAIRFVGQSGLAVSRDVVLAAGSITVASQRQFKLWAIDRRTGLQRWAALIAAPAFDSWSSPAIDLRTNTAVVASGSVVAAFDLTSGATKWQTTLAAPIVNASPLLTSGHGVGPQGGQWNGGLGIANRIFVTEYDGFGTDGSLTCINSDPYHAAANPLQPGAVLWSVPIGGSSGNTPAFSGGMVYVATLGRSGFGAGQILAFRADAATAPDLVWAFDNVIEEGFFGGVCVVPSSNAANAPASVFAASYAFSGARTSSNLVKLDASTGALRWSIGCNRTSATPIALADGRIVLSGGIRGFGSVPTIQVFKDQGTFATLLWDSAAATWVDSNGNGTMDLGEYTVLGGWSMQPAFASSPAAPRLFLGAISTNLASTAACTDLYAIDTSKLPFNTGGAAQPGYLAMHYVGAGSTPALADANLYTIGAAGLLAFGPPPPRCDVNSDGVVDIEDLYSWFRGTGLRDVNIDGSVNDTDRAVLEAELRRDEIVDMNAGRRP